MLGIAHVKGLQNPVESELFPDASNPSKATYWAGLRAENARIGELVREHKITAD